MTVVAPQDKELKFKPLAPGAWGVNLDGRDAMVAAMSEALDGERGLFVTLNAEFARDCLGSPDSGARFKLRLWERLPEDVRLAILRTDESSAMMEACIRETRLWAWVEVLLTLCEKASPDQWAAAMARVCAGTNQPHADWIKKRLALELEARL